MYNKIIYPIIIIIFSLLIIYVILRNKETQNFNLKIEKFLGEIKSNESLIKIKNNAMTNTTFTKKFLNGEWTSYLSTVDSNYIVNNIMIIDINENNNPLNNIYGNINVDLYINNKMIPINLNIGFVSNENIIATGNASTELIAVHIKIINKFNSNNNDKLIELRDKNNYQKCIVSIYKNDMLFNKYISYKLYDRKAEAELYRIILSKNFYVEKIPPIYDFNLYNLIINSYTYPPNYITFDGYNNLTTNTPLENTKISNINNKYNNKLKFCIQRVFTSPTGNEIITNLSSSIELDVVIQNKLPTTIKIVPFINDKNNLGLTNFYKPNSTILYFYKYISNDPDTFEYKNENKIPILNDLFKLSSINSATNMFKKVILHNNLGEGIVKNINNTYNLVEVGRKNSNLTEPTIFSFSELYNKL